MKTLLTTILIVLLVAGTVAAETKNTINSGSWFNPAIWDVNEIPWMGDDAHLHHPVTVNDPTKIAMCDWLYNDSYFTVNSLLTTFEDVYNGYSNGSTAIISVRGNGYLYTHKLFIGYDGESALDVEGENAQVQASDGIEIKTHGISVNAGRIRTPEIKIKPSQTDIVIHLVNGGRIEAVE